MNNYTSPDMNTWPRRTHWNYYRNIVKAAISITKKIDVTAVRTYCRTNNFSFSPVFLYLISKTVNSLDCMRIFADADGNPGIWDVVHPNYTIFHEDDETFSDVWIEYYPEMGDFLKNFENVLSKFGNLHGIKVRDDQPANFFCVSGMPWLSYEGLTTYTSGDRPPALFPIINYGRYEEENGALTMPMTITISHAAMDGYHVAKFFKRLEENIRELV